MIRLAILASLPFLLACDGCGPHYDCTEADKAFITMLLDRCRKESVFVVCADHVRRLACKPVIWNPADSATVQAERAPRDSGKVSP